MIEIYRAAHPIDAHLLRGLLEAEGIEAAVIGEYGFNVRGEAPMTTETLPRVAVAKEEDVARAREIAESFDRREPLEGVELQEAAMLQSHDAIATIAVKSLDAARRFYAETLGLEAQPTGEKGTISFKSGQSSLLVYESQFAGTNKATAATWIVGDDLDAIVSALRERGVRFEHYDDLPGTTRRGDIHESGKVRVAWCKDPDGNILSLVNG